MGRLYPKQKARLQSVHVPRPLFVSRCVERSDLAGEVGEELTSSCIIVLLLKQVHLQKDVAEAAREMFISARRVKMRKSLDEKAMALYILQRRSYEER